MCYSGAGAAFRLFGHTSIVATPPMRSILWYDLEWCAHSVPSFFLYTTPMRSVVCFLPSALTEMLMIFSLFFVIQWDVFSHVHSTSAPLSVNNLCNSVLICKRSDVECDNSRSRIITRPQSYSAAYIGRVGGNRGVRNYGTIVVICYK